VGIQGSLGSQRYHCLSCWWRGSIHIRRLEVNVKDDNGIHRLEDKRPPLTLRFTLGVRHSINLQPSIV
jgi:hypothetical protein